MSIICGVDPGLSGAICLYDPVLLHLGRVGCIVEIFDMPTLEITRNGKKRRRIDLYALAKWVDSRASGITKAFIENPQGMPGQSSNSSHQLGFNCGIIQGIVAANFIPMELIAPVTWKKRMGLTKDKDACRLKASQINPAESHQWARVKDDGRAEAFLIAYYGSQQQ